MQREVIEPLQQSEMFAQKLIYSVLVSVLILLSSHDVCVEIKKKKKETSERKRRPDKGLAWARAGYKVLVESPGRMRL